MKKTPLILVLMVLLSMIGICAAHNDHIAAGTWVGCIDKEDTKTLYKYLADGDKEAFL